MKNIFVSGIVHPAFETNEIIKSLKTLVNNYNFDIRVAQYKLLKEKTCDDVSNMILQYLDNKMITTCSLSVCEEKIVSCYYKCPKLYTMNNILTEKEFLIKGISYKKK